MHYLIPVRHFCTDFIRCGFIGWCLECFWTGLHSFKKRTSDKRLLCRTSMWMFPIYGLAAFIPSVYAKIRTKSFLFRGMIYSSAIMGCEYTSGTLLKRHNACPWDYSKAKLNYKGIVRLDYAPCWALAGLLFERILCKKTKA